MRYLWVNRNSYSFWSYQFKSFSTPNNVSISYIFWIVSRIYFLLKEILYILKTSRSIFYWTSCVKEKLKVQGNQLLNNGPWWRRLSLNQLSSHFGSFFCIQNSHFDSTPLKLKYLILVVLWVWSSLGKILQIYIYCLYGPCNVELRYDQFKDNRKYKFYRDTLLLILIV